MKRGDLYWARLEPRSGSEQQGRRPALVVSHDGFNEISTWRSLIVVPLTTSAKQGQRGPTAVRVRSGDGNLPDDSFALCHQITTLDRSKLEERIGHISRETLQRIGDGIAVACELPAVEWSSEG